MALGIGAYVSPPSQRYSVLKWIRKLARDRWLAQLVEHLAGPSCRKINLSQKSGKLGQAQFTSRHTLYT